MYGSRMGRRRAERYSSRCSQRVPNSAFQPCAPAVASASDASPNSASNSRRHRLLALPASRNSAHTHVRRARSLNCRCGHHRVA